MALPATDAFTAANGTNLTTYSANWTYVHDGDLLINTNALYSNGGDNTAVWDADTFANDQYSQVTVVAAASGVYGGLAVRGSLTLTSVYFYQVDSADAGYLQKWVNGSWTELSGAGDTIAVSDVIRLEAEGTTLRVKLNGVLDISQTDSSLASGYAGVSGAGTGTGTRTDDWEGGNLGAPATPAISVNDSITVSESVGRRLDSNRAASDTVTLSESANLTLVHDRTVSDSVTVAESVARLLQSHISTSDSVAVAEATTLRVESYLIASESVTVAESVTVQIEIVGDLVVSVSDNIAVTESIKLLIESYIATSDTISVAESMTPLLVHLVSVSDSVSAAETVARLLESYVSRSESITVAESVIALPLQSACINGVLTVSANGYYFQNDLGVIALGGSHTWNNRQDLDGIAAFDWDGYLDDLEAWGHNCFRFWVEEQAQNISTTPAPTTAASTSAITPELYVRTGPGNAADGGLKFDLTQVNPAFLDLLYTRCVQAGNRGMYVCVMLFNGWSIALKGGGENPWTHHPFRDTNNINSIDGDINNDGDGYEIQTLADSAVTGFQEDYITAILIKLNHLDNVFYEIANEADGGTDAVAWTNHMISHVQTVEAGLDKQHPVIFTVGWPGADNADLLASDAEAISPNGAYNTTDIDGSKVVFRDTDHDFGIGGDAEWVWSSFCFAQNTWYMDSWNNDIIDASGSGHPDQSLRDNIGYALVRLARMNLDAATPQSTLSTTGYCLANTSVIPHQYLAFQDGSGAFDLDVSATTGALIVEWLRVSDGDTDDGGTINGGAVRTLTPPWAGDAVAFIWQSTYAVSVSDGIAVTESVTVSVAGFGQMATSDSVAVSESVTLQVTVAISASESITVAESVQRLLEALPTVSDAISVAESVALALLVEPAVSDSVTVSESVTLLVESYIAAAESISVAESVTVLVIDAGLTVISVSESVAVAESVSVVPSDPQVAVSDSVSVSESAQHLLESLPAVSDAVGVAESVTLVALVDLVTTDSVAITESVQTAAGPLFTSVSDSITVAESVSVHLPLPGDTKEAAVSDSITVAELVTLIVVSMATPRERIYAVAHENRVVPVARENRTYPISGG